MDTAQLIVEADHRFDRAPVGDVLRLYKEYVAEGNYPYIDNVALWLSKRLGLDYELNQKNLSHEVYLASNVVQMEKDQSRVEQLERDGYSRATRGSLEVGQRYELLMESDGLLGRVTLREICVCREASDGRLFLMPKRARTKGYVVNGREMWVRKAA